MNADDFFVVQVFELSIGSHYECHKPPVMEYLPQYQWGDVNQYLLVAPIFA